jgi:hypothetical protein
VAAQEASTVGVNWTFAPMVDIARDARWGRIVEGAGEDPFLGAARASPSRLAQGFCAPHPNSGEIDLMLLAFPVVQAANLGQSGTKNLPNQKQRQNSGDHYD